MIIVFSLIKKKKDYKICRINSIWMKDKKKKMNKKYRVLVVWIICLIIKMFIDL